MATITCAISGLKLVIPHLPMNLPAKAGYYHPVFMLKQRQLWPLYRRHCEGTITATDSYLLFLALLHSSQHVQWSIPTALNPTDNDTIRLVECNIRQLVDTLQLTNTITIPSFKQPSFIISLANNDLKQIPNWIAAWNDNIDRFRKGRVSVKQQDSLQVTENRLSYFIKSGIDEAKYAGVIAKWADKASDFPRDKKESWCKIIRACFNTAKMFSTNLSDLREIKGYCEANIPSGSIHSSTLYKVLREGISRHTDYLGMNPIALGYTLLDVDLSKNAEKVEIMRANAPKEEPMQKDYPNALAFIRAKASWLAVKYKKDIVEEVIPVSESLEDLDAIEDIPELEGAELESYDPSDNKAVTGL